MNGKLDEDERMQKYFAALKEERVTQLQRHSNEIEEFCAFAATRGIALNSTDFDYAQNLGVFAKRQGIVSLLLAHHKKERDGLFRFSDLRSDFSFDAPGYLRGEKFIVMAHPHFRRSLSSGNGFAPMFVDKFWEIGDQFANSYIALDEDRVRVDLDHPNLVEADTWYGGSFSADICDIPVGHVKLRPPSALNDSMIKFFFKEAYALNLLWSQEKLIKTFQALEFKTERVTVDLDGRTYFPVRYVHAEYDLEMGSFRHFDGAMQYFEASDYYSRRDSNFNHNAKNLDQIKARSKKLFKFNDALTSTQFSDLCSHFWTGNPLGIEYFTGEYPVQIAEAIERFSTRAHLAT